MAFRIPGESAGEARFRQRLQRADAVREEQERQSQSMVARKIAHMELEEEMRRWQDRMAFDTYLLADRILERLIRMRDENRPKSADEEWNEEFCEAVRLIPEAKRFLDEAWMDTIKKQEERR